MQATLVKTENFSFFSCQGNAFSFTMPVSAFVSAEAASAGGLSRLIRRTTLVLASEEFHLARRVSHNAASRNAILLSLTRQPRQQRAENNLITLGHFLAAFSTYPDHGL